MPKPPRFSVIIPALNERALIRETIRRIVALDPAVEVVVADGGSADGTGAAACAEGALVVRSRRGRGIQCRRGAEAATGDLLIFLHADTLLPENAFDLLRSRFENRRVKVGTFRLAFREARPLLRLYAALTRFDSVFTRFGDQCIVARRSFYEKIGGFPDWPLFEDVHFLRKARRLTKIHSFPARVQSSARRFVRIGLVRTQLRNGWLIWRYLLGVPPAELAAQYAQADRKKTT